MALSKLQTLRVFTRHDQFQPYNAPPKIPLTEATDDLLTDLGQSVKHKLVTHG